MKRAVLTGAAVLAAAALAGAGVLLVQTCLAIVTIAGTLGELGVEAWQRH